jgi:hypothetical protein
VHLLLLQPRIQTVFVFVFVFILFYFFFFFFSVVAGFIYGDDLPHAYQRAVFGRIDATRVNNAFFSWWREKQHERFYTAHPSQRPGATPAAAAAAAAAKAPAASKTPSAKH